MGNLCCAREHSVQFFVQCFYTVKLHGLTYSVWGPLMKSDDISSIGIPYTGLHFLLAK
jgi:hypothetical protein